MGDLSKFFAVVRYSLTPVRQTFLEIRGEIEEKSSREKKKTEREEEEEKEEAEEEEEEAVVVEEEEEAGPWTAATLAAALVEPRFHPKRVSSLENRAIIETNCVWCTTESRCCRRCQRNNNVVRRWSELCNDGSAGHGRKT